MLRYCVLLAAVAILVESHPAGTDAGTNTPAPGGSGNSLHLPGTLVDFFTGVRPANATHDSERPSVIRGLAMRARQHIKQRMEQHSSDTTSDSETAST